MGQVALGYKRIAVSAYCSLVIFFCFAACFENVVWQFRSMFVHVLSKLPVPKLLIGGILNFRAATTF